MALSVKSEALKHVPWFSLAEWHQVYNQIYSNDTLEQTKAYATLLVWKARIPKLPVGVECTLSIIQVCLRDREWTPKIDRAELPMYYENDLCLMYSTTIMRFLNQISNIGCTKQSSLFQIAKQLKIPQWIVNLRHDAAHGQELPAIGSLRMAANVLLTWLHEEYWVAEANAVEERYEKSVESASAGDSCESQAFVIFIELWIAVGLYIKANYVSVRALPDAELRDMLLNLCTVLPDSPERREIAHDFSGSTGYDNNYLLSDAQSILFSEISTLISKNKSLHNIEDAVVKLLLESEAFLASPEMIGIFMPKGESFDDWKQNELPVGMTNFWQDFIALLCDKKLLDELVWRLIELVNSNHEETNRRLVGSLWLKSICQALVKLKCSQTIDQAMEHSLDDKEKRLGSKQRVQRVRARVNKIHPELASAMWLNYASSMPAFLQDINFATDILLNANAFTMKFIQPILVLVTPALSFKRKQLLIKLARVHTNEETFKGNNSVVEIEENRIYGVEDLIKICGESGKTAGERRNENGAVRGSYVPALADRTIRNSKWEIVSDENDWAACAFGVLPWQAESLEMLEPAVVVQPQPATTSAASTIVPGLVDSNDLTMESHVNWDNVLRKKKRLKRKLQLSDSDVMVDRAIEMVKKRHK